jgi:cell division protease FtsH
MKATKLKRPKISPFKQIALWVLIFILLIALYQRFQEVGRQKTLTYSEFKSKIAAGVIEKVTIGSDVIKGTMKENNVIVTFKTIPVTDDNLVEDLQKANVVFEGQPDRGWVASVLLNVGWIALFFFLWWFLFIRQVQGGGRQALSFGKSRAKKQDLSKQKITFADVAGCKEAKEELQDVVEYLKNPKKFKRLGGVLPKGVLLYGSPGTGKTLLARAVAGEAQVPFFTSSGSEFVEMFVGVGASRVRDLFEQAKRNIPAIVFIDELDAVGRYRFAGVGGGHDEREQTLNQILVELDGFEGKEGVVLLAATNRPDVLDPALLRPGRFDRHVNIPIPDKNGRLEILQVHAKKVHLSDKVDLSVIARHTPGFVGSDLANIINEAAILAARHDKEAVEMAELEEATERIIAGPQRKSRVISEREKKIIACHESGHAMVAKLIPGCDPVHKVSIIPRGPALGYTLQLPLEDKYLTTKTEILNKIKVLLGGRAAEEIMFGEITTGAHDDLVKVTSLARNMVAEYGMSEKLGPISLKKPDTEVFLGKEISQQRKYSEQMARYIDEEVDRILQTAYTTVKKILSLHKKSLQTLVNKLIEKEVVGAELMDEILKNSSALEGGIKQKENGKAKDKAETQNQGGENPLPNET